MKIADFMTSGDHSIWFGIHDQKIIPSGTFVKPIEFYWVPKHVVDDSRWSKFDKTKEVFCYTSYGFIPLPRSLLRSV